MWQVNAIIIIGGLWGLTFYLGYLMSKAMAEKASKKNEE